MNHFTTNNTPNTFWKLCGFLLTPILFISIWGFWELWNSPKDWWNTWKLFRLIKGGGVKVVDYQKVENSNGISELDLDHYHIVIEGCDYSVTITGGSMKLFLFERDLGPNKLMNYLMNSIKWSYGTHCYIDLFYSSLTMKILKKWCAKRIVQLADRSYQRDIKLKQILG